MPSSYSTNLKIELQATGENSGTWGTITNTNLGTALEQAIVGYGNPSYASDANLTLTYTDTNAAQAARALVLNVTSAVSLTNTRELVVPTIQKQYIVQNNTTGSQSITVKTSGGTGITVPNGRKAHLYVNGTDVIYMDDYVDINGGAIDGTPIGANSASTGAFTTLSASGNITVSGGTANGVLYLNGSKVATSGSALVFDGTNLGVGTASPSGASGTAFVVNGGAGQSRLALKNTNSGDASTDGFQIALLSDGVNVVYQNRESGYQSWELAGSEQMRLNSTGLGIGTSSPVIGFTVQKDNGSGYIAAFRSAAGSPYITLQTTSGITQIQGINSAFTATNDIAMQLSGGNVGIGTSSPATFGKLAVYGSGTAPVIGAFLGSNSPGTGATLADLSFGARLDGTVTAIIRAIANDNGNGTDGQLTFWTADNTASAAATERARITAAGDVGIGTSSPAANLDVAGNARFRSSGNWMEFATNVLTSNDNSGAEIRSIISDAAAPTYGWKGDTDTGIFTPGANILGFTTGGAERARITSGGDVGIGTGSPSSILHVQKGNGVIRLDNGDGNYSSWQQTGSDTRFATQSAIPLIFFTNATERARIGSNGDIYLNGSTVLNGFGNENVTEFYYSGSSSNAYLAINNAGSNSLAYLSISSSASSSGATTFFNFAKTGTTVGTITTNGTNTAYNTSSDRRLKDNIAPANDAGSVIDAMEVVKHDWKSGGHTRYGMIAQDLYKVAPEAVSIGDEDGVEELKTPWGVDYSKLVPMLVKEIQSLRARVAQLESK